MTARSLVQIYNWSPFISFNFNDEQSLVFDAYNPYSAFVAMNTIAPLTTAAPPRECICY